MTKIKVKYDDVSFAFLFFTFKTFVFLLKHIATSSHFILIFCIDLSVLLLPESNSWGCISENSNYINHFGDLAC